MTQQRHWDDPKQIAQEYEAGKQFKCSLGARGLYEQNKVNERFYVGDQWHGVNCGADKPLVRENIIKRIGEYKMAFITSAPLSVNYTADGVPNTLETKEQTHLLKSRLREAQASGEVPLSFNDELCERPLRSAEELNLVMSALSDYFRVTAERVGLESIKEKALRNAYMFGTGIVYTYWDERVKTGLYADRSRKHPIYGDIRCEVLDVENVTFGDPTCDSVEEQPYILISQRKSLAEIRRMMRVYGQKTHAQDLKPDETDVPFSVGREEAQDSQKATLITKLYKSWDAEGKQYRILATQTCGEVTVRRPWDIGVRRYPLSVFTWERRKNCAYGESEITYLIPNQIAINRMVTASVWAVMMMGIPIMVVNGDVVPQKLTNDPGQVVKVYGSGEDVQSAIRYVQPPNFSPKFNENIAALISNTMSQAGANDALLGNVRPDNTSAIIALREAAAMPLQSLQTRFYGFMEDLSRVFAEFWVMQYGNRALKIEDENGIWYLPFDGNRYRDVLISVQVDVGASSMWSEMESIQTLDNLFDRGIVNVEQYLSRLPKGIVPNLNGLLRELNTTPAPAEAPTAQDAAKALAAEAEELPNVMPSGEELMAMLSPEQQEQWASLSPEEQRDILEQAL